MKPTIRSTALAAFVLVATPWTVACAATSSQESAGEYIDDSTITTKAKHQLLQDKDVSSLRVKVETYKGRMQLSGFVSTQNEKIKTEKLTHSVPGVRSISNDLIVKAD